MSFIPSSDFVIEVQKGNVEGHSMWGMMGEREGMGTPTTGEDLWRGNSDVIPEPSSSGVQMAVDSTSDSDTAAGTGVRQVLIHYIDGAGDAQTETVTMNGTTKVNTVATDIRHVNYFHAVSVGTGGVAAGNITIELQGSPATVYNYIQVGGNKDLTCKYMVPAGHKLHLIGWHAGVSSDDRVSMRLRSTDWGGVLYEDIYLFKSVLYLAKATSGSIDNYATIPALSKIKVSAFPDQNGGEASTCCYGMLIQDGF